ncbi:MAG: hypothetical protein RRY34_06260 [Victivallaceae bacterium]
MTKKIIMAMLLIGVAVQAYAANAYQYGTISSSNNDYGNTKVDAFIDRGNGVSSGLQNTMYFNNSCYISISLSKGEPSKMGAYYLNGKTKGEEITLVAKNGVYTAVDSNGQAIKFQKNDAIGFWIDDVNGKKVYNTPKIDGVQNTYNGTIVKNDEYTIGFGNYGQYVNSTSYDQVMNDASYVLGVKVGADNPVGQPLPGTVLSLLVFSVAAGGFYILHRKKQQAAITVNQA